MRSLARLLLGARLTLREFFADRGIDRSSALAYITLLSLVPLLATVAALYRAFFPYGVDRLIEMVTLILPYEPGTEMHSSVTATLTEFVGQATTIGYVGSLVFLVIAFRLFVVIESTFNDIWHVRRRRSAATHVFSFTMVVFWGPVVIGLGSSVLLWMGHQQWAPSQGLVLSIARMVLPLVGLTMVYWLAPHTGVRITSALVGGITATAGLQLLRHLFVSYLQLIPEINIIYGSLTLAVLFLVSLFLFWMLVIVGAEASYVAQNIRALEKSEALDRATAIDPGELAAASLTECYRRLAVGEPAPSLDELERRLEAPRSDLQQAIEQLVNGGILAVTGAARDRYVPAHAAERLSVGAAINCCVSERTGNHIVGRGEVLERLGRLLRSGDAARREALDRTKFVDLLEEAESASEEPSRDS